MKTVNIAFSPCPNDTFIFHAMVHSLVDTGDFRFIPRLYDVETLNEFALAEKYEVTKLSFHAYLHLKDRYGILESGSALGFGCGPLLVKGGSTKSIGDMTIAIPGRYTTAFMLLRLWEPAAKKIIPVRFDYILEGVQNGTYDAGLIIHEGRFVYKNYGWSRLLTWVSGGRRKRARPFLSGV
jgi:1,4-dihydroxy-6-naphthoate synthase